MTGCGDPDWAAVRAAYCGGRDSIAGIVAEFGIGRATLYRKIRAENWPRRSAGAEEKPRTLAGRLRRVVERQLVVLEQRLTAPTQAADGDAAQRERDARTIGTLVRIYEKLQALQGPGEGEITARDADRIDHEIRDIEERRNALAERLAELSRKSVS